MKLKLAIAALCITLSTTTSASIMEAKDLNGSERPGIVLVDILKPIISPPNQMIAKIDNDKIKSNLVDSLEKNIKSLCGGYFGLTTKCSISRGTSKQQNTALFAPN
ncbi:hypothetical protein [Pseudoalteromonas marina]|uniref:Secreted protein n=1 Tax=Pseudoalteromonas marina TaxID=267375 RepID=A0ABT9FI19_9GAMM|nr:hypothetical protein [Pseudoalteromonas marina]MDP2566417.1 hypothetical protein [Pseudoalteromonas marina]